MTPEMGHHIAGFIDGEACFQLGRRKNGSYFATFTIALRDDDEPWLREIREACGGIGCFYRQHPASSIGRPQVVWQVTARRDCLALLAILDRYPLRSKKARDYDVWRSGVLAWAQRDYPRLLDLSVLIREGRRYQADPVVQPSSAQMALEVPA